MIKLVQDLKKVNEMSNHGSNVMKTEATKACDELDLDTVKKDHEMLKRKVELINSKDHSLSQRLLSVEDRVLDVLNKKAPQPKLGTQDILALSNTVNGIQPGCRCESTPQNYNSSIQNDVLALKADQNILKKEVLNLRNFVKEDGANTLSVLKDIDAKIEQAHVHNQKIRSKDINQSTEIISQQGIEDGVNKTNDLSQCMERIDHVDRFLLELTKSVDNIAKQMQFINNATNGKKNNNELASLRNLLRNILGMLKDFDATMMNEKGEIAKLMNHITELERSINGLKFKQQPDDIQNEIQKIKSELRSLSSAVQRLEKVPSLLEQPSSIRENHSSTLDHDEIIKQRLTKLHTLVIELTAVVNHIVQQQQPNPVEISKSLETNATVQKRRNDEANEKTLLTDLKRHMNEFEAATKQEIEDIRKAIRKVPSEASFVTRIETLEKFVSDLSGDVRKIVDKILLGNKHTIKGPNINEIELNATDVSKSANTEPSKQFALDEVKSISIRLAEVEQQLSALRSGVGQKDNLPTNSVFNGINRSSPYGFFASNVTELAQKVESLIGRLDRIEVERQNLHQNYQTNPLLKIAPPMRDDKERNFYRHENGIPTDNSTLHMKLIEDYKNPSSDETTSNTARLNQEVNIFNFQIVT